MIKIRVSKNAPICLASAYLVTIVKVYLITSLINVSIATNMAADIRSLELHKDEGKQLWKKLLVLQIGKFLNES